MKFPAQFAQFGLLPFSVFGKLCYGLPDSLKSDELSESTSDLDSLPINDPKRYKTRKKKGKGWSLAFFLTSQKYRVGFPVECTMQRLRGAGTVISRSLAVTQLRKKAFRSWAAVQDTYFSTKVLALSNFLVFLWVWANGGTNCFSWSFVWFWCSFVGVSKLFGFSFFAECFRIYLKRIRLYLQLELP